MEKYSGFRDAGTGIQPFLTPVPPARKTLLHSLLLPLLLLALARLALLLLLLLAYVVLVPVLSSLLLPIQPAHLFISHLFTAVLARASLFVLGLFWIPEEIVSRKRLKGVAQPENWVPRPGDIIVSNWVSWIELLWLAARFNPVFILPVTHDVPLDATGNTQSPISHTPARRTATAPVIQSAAPRAPSEKVPISGFRPVSLLAMIKATGSVPPYQSSHRPSVTDLETIRKTSNRPLVIFPECTTSNGRGLLRFSNVFCQTVPVRNYRVFVMCVRYDPPTAIAPTLTLPIPCNTFSPLPHVWSLLSSLSPLSMSVRLLSPSDSPSSPLFTASDLVSGAPGEDQLAESCAALVAHIGKLKRIAMGWEDKTSFLRFYQGKQH